MPPMRIILSFAVGGFVTGAAWATGGWAGVGSGSGDGSGTGAGCVSCGAGEAARGVRGEVDADGDTATGRDCVGSGVGAGMTGGSVSGGVSRSAGGGSKRKSRNSGGVVLVASCANANGVPPAISASASAVARVRIRCDARINSAIDAAFSTAVALNRP